MNKLQELIDKLENCKKNRKTEKAKLIIKHKKKQYDKQS